MPDRSPAGERSGPPGLPPVVERSSDRSTVPELETFGQTKWHGRETMPQQGRIGFMRYRLRTLLIVLAVVPALIGGTYWLWFEFEKSRHQAYYDGKRWYIHPDNVPPGHHLEVD